MGNDFYHFTIFGCVCVHSSDLHAVVEDSLPVILVHQIVEFEAAVNNYLFRKFSYFRSTKYIRLSSKT